MSCEQLQPYVAMALESKGDTGRTGITKLKDLSWRQMNHPAAREVFEKVNDETLC